MVIVEPKNGFPKVDREFAIVQSEWYFGGQGQPADIARSMETVAAPDFVVFNGVANQYKDHPLLVDTGKTVRIFLLDAGPNVWESFHVVGTIFNTVIKEGIELLPGNASGWGSQAVDLAPAQGAIVQFATAEDGLYLMVTHQFNDVSHGAVGVVQSGDGVYRATSQR
jgi:nitrite reductase (NO-forming)